MTYDEQCDERDLAESLTLSTQQRDIFTNAATLLASGNPDVMLFQCGQNYVNRDEVVTLLRTCAKWAKAQ